MVLVQVLGIGEEGDGEGPSRSHPVASHGDGAMQGGSALYLLRLEHLLCHREYRVTMFWNRKKRLLIVQGRVISVIYIGHRSRRVSCKHETKVKDSNEW